MLRYSWSPRAFALWLIGLFLVGLTLVACGGTTEPASEEAAAPAKTEEVVNAPADEEEVAESEAAATEEVAGEQETAATEETETDEAAGAGEETTAATSDENLLTDTAEPAAVCQTVEVPDNELIAAASDTDWAKGPADAPVTLIEYGDFQ